MTAPGSGAAPEFSRLVSVSRLPASDRVEISASEPERAALAQRFDLVAIDRLTAELHLTRLAGAAIRLDGQLQAAVVQSCVVTLEPVAATVSEAFTLVYAPPTPHGDTVELAPEEDPVEPLVGDTIDLGEAVAQQLSLALDPYPHAAGAVLPDAASSPPAPEDHPFAALAKLKKGS
jgi:uncharacterized metal-binding protein YceD (DUF177 family)